jgi:hypothetical protein
MVMGFDFGPTIARRMAMRPVAKPFPLALKDLKMSTTTALPGATFKTDASGVKADTAHAAANGNGDILTMGGGAANAGFQELAKAYQELAIKNANRLTTSMHALAATKSPTEFFELQRKLMTEGVEAAVADSTHIAKLTTAAFAAAFEPIQKQVAATKIM